MGKETGSLETRFAGHCNLAAVLQVKGILMMPCESIRRRYGFTPTTRL